MSVKPRWLPSTVLFLCHKLIIPYSPLSGMGPLVPVWKLSLLGGE
jgi:hypothetical protein